MKNSTKLILIIWIITTIIGTLTKINGYKTIGNVFLATSVIAFLYLLYLFIFKYLNKK